MIMNCNVLKPDDCGLFHDPILTENKERKPTRIKRENKTTRNYILKDTSRKCQLEFAQSYSEGI
jgi:hypothetical protein